MILICCEKELSIYKELSDKTDVYICDTCKKQFNVQEVY